MIIVKEYKELDFDALFDLQELVDSCEKKKELIRATKDTEFEEIPYQIFDEDEFYDTKEYILREIEAKLNKLQKESLKRTGSLRKRGYL